MDYVQVNNHILFIWLSFILFCNPLTLFRREHEITEIDEKIETFEFEVEDEVFEEMLYDIVQPERIVIDKCVPIFEKLALENERKSSNEPTWWSREWKYKWIQVTLPSCTKDWPAHEG